MRQLICRRTCEWLEIGYTYRAVRISYLVRLAEVAHIHIGYCKHENTKKRAYEQRVREVEHGSFTPLVLSLTGGMGCAATVCYKRLASLIAQKRDQPYSCTMAWVRCCLSFALLRSSIQCIRGARSSIGQFGREPLPPVDLVTSEANLTV